MLYLYCMKLDNKDKNRCGIYMIVNTFTGKVYIGKSINIYTRIKQHINQCNSKNLDENRHLINSWHKYSSDVFVYLVLEYLPKTEELLKERELYWIIKTNALNRNCGYNLRLDSDTKMIVSQETRKLMSENRKLYYKKHPERRLKISKASKEYFSNKENRQKVSKSVTKAKQAKHKFAQYSRNGDFIRIWDTVEEILLNNPNYKWQNIYAVCSGYKPTYMNYQWRKYLKNEDIVQISMKIESK